MTRWRGHVCIVACIAVCCLCGTVSGVRAADNADAYLKAIADVRESLQSFRVECRMTQVRRIPDTEQDVRQSVKATFWTDASSRVRCESQFEQTGQGAGSPSGRMEVAVFDGQSVRRMAGGAKFEEAVAEPHVAAAYPQGLNPREFISDLEYQPLADLLASRGTPTVSEATWQDRKVVVLEMPAVENVGREWSGRVLLDPERGFSVVKTASVVRYPDDPDHPEWVEFVRREVVEQEHDASGLWLPRRARFVECFVPAEFNPEPVPMRSAEIVFENWEVNPELPDDLFTLTYQPGVRVNDRVTGQDFVAYPVTDQMVADQVAAAKQIDPRPPASNILIRWLIGVTIAAIALSIAGYGYFQRRA